MRILLYVDESQYSQISIKMLEAMRRQISPIFSANRKTAKGVAEVTEYKRGRVVDIGHCHSDSPYIECLKIFI
jgi:hypothetical protein